MLLNGNNFHVSQILSFTSIEIYTAIAKGPHISLCFFLISQQFKAKVVACRFSKFKMNFIILMKSLFLFTFINQLSWISSRFLTSDCYKKWDKIKKTIPIRFYAELYHQLGSNRILWIRFEWYSNDI